jgi:hypothetical protein
LPIYRNYLSRDENRLLRDGFHLLCVFGGILRDDR